MAALGGQCRHTQPGSRTEDGEWRSGTRLARFEASPVFAAKRRNRQGDGREVVDDLETVESELETGEIALARIRR